MASASAPRGRKLAKNKKKSWKTIDTKAVDEYLENERLIERTGGSFGFAVDTDLKPASDSTDSAAGVTRRQKWENKKLNCYSSIGPNPLTKPARVPHNVPAVKEKSVKTKKTKKQIQAEENRKKTLSENKKRKRQSQPCQFEYNLWGDTRDKTEGDEHYQVVTKKRKPNLPGYRHQKPSKLSAVEVPHPGASYNPAADDWQDLLWKAHGVEVKKEKEEKRLHRALEAKFPTRDQAPTEQTWMAEMSAGLFEGEDEDDAEVVLFDNPDCLSVNKAVTRERAKTSKQQRRKHELKLEKAKTQREKQEKGKLVDIRHKLKDIESDMKQREEAQQTKAEKKAKQTEEAKFQTKRLGQMKFEEPELELKLSEELVGSLRELKPEGNLLEDRFKSLIKRNVMEPRGRARRRRKYKLKTFERKGHREVKA